MDKSRVYSLVDVALVTRSNDSIIITIIIIIIIYCVLIFGRPVNKSACCDKMNFRKRISKNGLLKFWKSYFE